MSEAERVVEVASSRFRLVGDEALVEASRQFVYPLPAGEGAAPTDVRLSASDSRVRAEGPFGVIEAGSAEELLERLDYELTTLALARLEGAAALHAGCVGLPGGGSLLILGVHLSGKSTMASALSKLGLPLYCDDITLARTAPFGVRPLPRVIRVRADSARLLGVEGESALVHRVAPAEWREGWAVPKAAVEVRFRPGTSPVLTRLSAPESTTLLLGSVFGFRDAMPERLAVMAALEGTVPQFRLTHGLAPVESAKWLLEQLEAAL